MAAGARRKAARRCGPLVSIGMLDATETTSIRTPLQDGARKTGPHREDAEQRDVDIALRVGGDALAQELVARQVAVAEVELDLQRGRGGLGPLGGLQKRALAAAAMHTPPSRPEERPSGITCLLADPVLCGRVQNHGCGSQLGEQQRGRAQGALQRRCRCSRYLHNCWASVRSLHARFVP